MVYYLLYTVNYRGTFSVYDNRSVKFPKFPKDGSTKLLLVEALK